MKEIKNPRTLSELYRLIDFLNFKINNPNFRNNPREVFFIYKSINKIILQSKLVLEKNNDNIHSRIANTLERWMKDHKNIF